MLANYRIIIAIFFLFYCQISISQELPIKVARTISFVTDEGSYMNVDVSPDGKTLLFDLLGDLYHVGVNGGIAQQITRGLSLNLRPTWSPDGNYIAYISDRSGDYHLHMRNINGKVDNIIGRKDKSLYYGENPVWLHNNSVFVQGKIYNNVGNELPGHLPFKRPLLSTRDGKKTFFLNRDSLFEYNNEAGLEKFLTTIPNTYQGLVMSPNGSLLAAYIDTSEVKRSLVVLNLTTRVEKSLVNSIFDNGTAYKPSVPLTHFSFSPDSKFIYISYGGKIHRIEIESGSDNIIPFSANVKANLGALNYNTRRLNSDSLKVKYTRSASLNPGGKQLVFTALNKIYLKDMPNGKPRQLIKQPVNQFQPAWSPDGTWVAYVTWCDTIGGFLWRASADGKQMEQLTKKPGQYQRPVWSPDGKYIAVVHAEPKFLDRDDPGTGTLELVDVNDKAINIIDDTVPLWNLLSFSADGKRIIYQPSDKSDEEGPLYPLLISRDLEGKDRQVIGVGDNMAYMHYVLHRSISPDGKYFLYSGAEDLYLVPLRKLTNPQFVFSNTKNLSAIRFSEGVDPHWTNNGNIEWTYGNHYYETNPDNIIKAAEKEIGERRLKNQYNDSAILTVSIIPDRTIALNVKVPTFYGSGTIALKNVRIITMQKAKVIEGGTVIIKDGRFLAVGSAKNISIPKRAKIYDLDGTTIMPGIIDIHDHMRVPPDVFPQQSWMFLANLAYGVTTARDPSDNLDSYGYAELLQSGQMIGPRLFTVGRSVRLPDGLLRCDNINDVRAAVHKRKLFGGTEIKQYTLPTRLQRQWLSIACREQGMNMTNEGDYDPLLQIAMIKDGSTGIEHNPVWGDVYDDIINLLAKSGTYLTPALQVCYGLEEGKEWFKYKYWRFADDKMRRFILSDPSRPYPTGNGAETLEAILNSHPKDTINPGFLIPAHIDTRFLHAGAMICIGGHGNDEGIGTHNEIWALQMGGFSNIQALQAATINGAKALGIQEDVGSIEVGKIADLIILNKNPLENIHNTNSIRFVMKAGILYDSNTLDEVWPTQKKGPVIWR